jgi:RNA 3'-terminal phosphate cyclase (ATP)
MNEKDMNLIELDGSTGEGGGQILRSALALAMCTGQPMRIQHIRAKRPKPGLMRQHLTCVQAAVAVCGAKVEGAELGSQTLVFEPGAVRAGDYAFNVGTAGSCTLVLQTVLPALMLCAAPSRVQLTGGTHNPMAPPFHFLERSFAPLLRRLGVGLELALRRLGFIRRVAVRFRRWCVPQQMACSLSICWIAAHCKRLTPSASHPDCPAQLQRANCRLWAAR